LKDSKLEIMVYLKKIINYNDY